MSQADPPSAPVPEAKVQFHYIKSNLFRVAHADGAHGGITPRGLVELNFYSERRAIPQIVVHTIASDGTLGGELRDERVSRSGVIREVEFGAIMDRDTAVSVIEWLQERVRQLDEIAEQRGENDDADS